MKKYFHELTPTEKFRIYNLRIPWYKTARDYPQPIWCKHQQAIDGLLGCQDLWTGFVKSEKECEDCEWYKKGKI